MRRFKWTPENVTSTEYAEGNIRSYIERTQLRNVLSGVRVGAAADVGCGFGRLSVVLLERAAKVVGFEREAGLAKKARRLVEGLDVRNVESLSDLPAGDAEFDFAMTFTVVQHMKDKDAKAVIGEMKRIVRPGGSVLLTEDTDPDYRYVDRADATHFTYGRSVERYETWMAPFRLLRSEPRKVEPGYSYKKKPRPTVGHYMLFGVSA